MPPSMRVVVKGLNDDTRCSQHTKDWFESKQVVSMGYAGAPVGLFTYTSTVESKNSRQNTAPGLGREPARPIDVVKITRKITNSCAYVKRKIKNKIQLQITLA